MWPTPNRPYLDLFMYFVFPTMVGSVWQSWIRDWFSGTNTWSLECGYLDARALDTKIANFDRIRAAFIVVTTHSIGSMLLLAPINLIIFSARCRKQAVLPESVTRALYLVSLS
jgi:hypothetical protein